jgi:hypothetical protein
MQYGEEAYFQKVLKISKAYTDQSNPVKAVETAKTKIDVSFMPEGGELLANHDNIVAFAAINNRGNPAEVNLRIMDDASNIVIHCKSTYQGLGKFLFSPELGKSYCAFINEDPNFRYDFIGAKKHGIKLELKKTTDEEVHFHIASNTKMYFGSTFHFTIMNRGHLVFEHKFDFAQNPYLFKVKKDALPPGVNRIVLLNKNLKPVSERMYFSNNDHVRKVDIAPNKCNFGTRSPIVLELSDKHDD